MRSDRRRPPITGPHRRVEQAARAQPTSPRNRWTRAIPMKSMSYRRPGEIVIAIGNSNHYDGPEQHFADGDIMQRSINGRLQIVEAFDRRSAQCRGEMPCNSACSSGRRSLEPATREIFASSGRPPAGAYKYHGRREIITASTRRSSCFNGDVDAEHGIIFSGMKADAKAKIASIVAHETRLGSDVHLLYARDGHAAASPWVGQCCRAKRAMKPGDAAPSGVDTMLALANGVAALMISPAERHAAISSRRAIDGGGRAGVARHNVAARRRRRNEMKPQVEAMLLCILPG